ncbi:MAG: type II toxin-antitoxin system RelE/ParE family toxin [Bacteroides sp.]|nr:type II toxin-antitoxin system RelE/ParE family toxin [Ruminococcus flavefaciens]MCM1554268.1 type II toxin-antitoxin system RelE/ParE family toxin [Bacteroides sp.]
MASRTIKFYKQYFNEFWSSQNSRVKKKIAQTLVWLQEVDRLPVSILRSIEGVKGLFEIRLEVGRNIFRIFCCFDKGNIVVLFNAFQKKTQKTPQNEIAKAAKLMNEYFDTKEDENK